VGSAAAVHANNGLGWRLSWAWVYRIWLVIHWLIQPQVADGWAHPGQVIGIDD